MRTFLSFVEAKPGLYFSGCLLLGFTLRLAMCHGDFSLFCDPFYPMFHR